jgi:hypothetical protein
MSTHNRAEGLRPLADTLHYKEDTSTVPVGLVRTYPAEGMKAWRVNQLKGNGPELLERPYWRSEIMSLQL